MVAGSTVFATIVNPCSTSAFSPLIQSGEIVFKGIKNMEHQNQVQAFPFLLTPFFSISGAVKASDRTGLYHHRCRQHQDRYPRKGNRS